MKTVITSYSIHYTKLYESAIMIKQRLTDLEMFFVFVIQIGGFHIHLELIRERLIRRVFSAYCLQGGKLRRVKLRVTVSTGGCKTKGDGWLCNGVQIVTFAFFHHNVKALSGGSYNFV